MITLIAAIGQDNEIGFDNKLLWKIPEDMNHFKEYTMGKVIVMGRKTYESIGRSLPGRKCIVVTSSLLNNAVITAKSVEDALSIDYCYPEIVIIGGETLYKQTINRANKLVITHVHHKFIADCFFPQINKDEWVVNSSIDSSNADYKYTFVEYLRK